MIGTAKIVDDYERGREHVRRMTDRNRIVFLRGCIDAIDESASPETRKEASRLLQQLFESQREKGA